MGTSDVFWPALAWSDSMMSWLWLVRIAWRWDQPGGLMAFDELQRRLTEVLKANPPLQLQDLAISGRDIMKALDLSPGHACRTAVAEPLSAGAGESGGQRP